MVAQIATEFKPSQNSVKLPQEAILQRQQAYSGDNRPALAITLHL